MVTYLLVGKTFHAGYYKGGFWFWNIFGLNIQFKNKFIHKNLSYKPRATLMIHTWTGGASEALSLAEIITATKHLLACKWWALYLNPISHGISDFAALTGRGLRDPPQKPMKWPYLPLLAIDNLLIGTVTDHMQKFQNLSEVSGFQNFVKLRFRITLTSEKWL